LLLPTEKGISDVFNVYRRLPPVFLEGEIATSWVGLKLLIF
jgi:hypothetical protein